MMINLIGIISNIIAVLACMIMLIFSVKIYDIARSKAASWFIFASLYGIVIRILILFEYFTSFIYPYQAEFATGFILLMMIAIIGIYSSIREVLNKK